MSGNMTACRACGSLHSCLCSMALALDGAYTCKGCLDNYNKSLAPKTIEKVDPKPEVPGAPYQVPAPVINSITHFNNY